MISIDTSDARRLAVELDSGTARTLGEVTRIVSRGALNIKNQLIREAKESASFKGFAPAISYDLEDSGHTAIIGPETGRPGSLANIAYFGTSRGGGTVKDPGGALLDETPRFLRELERLAGVLE